ncbi:hypothetical protein P171DRAFT_39900 [Karstenula rhodostoma CBS 690.94]|uniref:Uncharacterized protein n=1 Tax=Karstenula rhodostoma CBS 690.94 TaxID=1392251 RepID=A0A9P4PGI1_9PLEO|nr:hypothetical protein P171DRAFT_39900 [Karstenula rhodostoma CBS 690.94]
MDRLLCHSRVNTQGVVLERERSEYVGALVSIRIYHGCVGEDGFETAGHGFTTVPRFTRWNGFKSKAPPRRHASPRAQKKTTAQAQAQAQIRIKRVGMRMYSQCRWVPPRSQTDVLIRVIAILAAADPYTAMIRRRASCVDPSAFLALLCSLKPTRDLLLLRRLIASGPWSHVAASLTGVAYRSRSSLTRCASHRIHEAVARPFLPVAARK